MAHEARRQAAATWHEAEEAEASDTDSELAEEQRLEDRMMEVSLAGAGYGQMCGGMITYRL